MLSPGRKRYPARTLLADCTVARANQAWFITIQQRRLAFSLARDGLDDALDDLDLSESSSDDVEQGEDALETADIDSKDGRFDDAKESLVRDHVEGELQQGAQSTVEKNATGSNKNNKSRRHMPKRIRKKVHNSQSETMSDFADTIQQYKLYADRLMQGEILDLEGEGLPPDLAGEWLALGPIPKGKRCMALTFASTRTSRQGRGESSALHAFST